MIRAASWLLLAAVLCAGDAFADEAAGRVFRANQGVKLRGRNEVTGTVCSARFFDTSMLYSFGDDLSDAESHEEALNRHANSISAGHFHKRALRRELEHRDGGAWSPSCLLLGRCRKSSLSIRYDGDGRVTEFSETFEDRLEGRCLISSR